MTNPFKIENLSRVKDCGRLWMKYGGSGILAGARPGDSFELEFLSPEGGRINPDANRD
jgi:hypothetical protein